ncbi:MAG: DUF4422 domain-containing protein, partial [Enterococcus sp.]|nr:DUF4422 domain-containing protein [Enterococcus sp.]
MKALREIFRENHYPIVHGYNSTMNVFGMKAAKDCHIPIRINESISMGHKGEGKSFVKNLLRPFSKCYATHLMATGVTCGIWQFGEVAYQAGKIQVFKTAINTQKQHFDAALREETRKKFQLEEHLVIGHIGRLTPQKNTLFLIDIFSEIHKLEPKAKLLLIGDGDLRKPMEEKIQNYGLQNAVLDLGRREDIYQFYNAMDCFVLPSLYEGLPLVGVESQCVGLPVFFSTEIPHESSACEDLGIFIGLDQSATQWAETVLEKTKTAMLTRRDRSEEVKEAGFDSAEEAKKLERFYLQEIRNTESELMDTQIFVISHKETRMPEDSLYVPMQVGFADTDFSGYLRDNTGDNIAQKNKNFCELTALYWIWKNCDADVKGLVHYRRLLADTEKVHAKSIDQKYERLLKQETIECLLQTNDIILPKAHCYYTET